MTQFPPNRHPYLPFLGGSGPKGQEPSFYWEKARATELNKLRNDDHHLRAVGNMVGQLVLSTGDTKDQHLLDAGNNFADAFQPPLSAVERETFMAGIGDVIAMKNIVGEV